MDDHFSAVEFGGTVAVGRDRGRAGARRQRRARRVDADAVGIELGRPDERLRRVRVDRPVRRANQREEVLAVGQSRAARVAVPREGVRAGRPAPRGERHHAGHRPVRVDQPQLERIEVAGVHPAEAERVLVAVAVGRERTGGQPGGGVRGRGDPRVADAELADHRADGRGVRCRGRRDEFRRVLPRRDPHVALDAAHDPPLPDRAGHAVPDVAAGRRRAAGDRDDVAAVQLADLRRTSSTRSSASTGRPRGRARTRRSRASATRATSWSRSMSSCSRADRGRAPGTRSRGRQAPGRSPNRAWSSTATCTSCRR